MVSPWTFKPKLWVLPWGLFPPRVLIYLREKGIVNDFEIIPLGVGPTDIEPAPGQPKETTTPLLEIAPPSSEGETDGKYIYQSLAIIEYLEDVYGPGSGTPNLRGSTAEERARMRDGLAMLSEAVDMFAFYTHNASKVFEQLEKQDRGAAAQALTRMHSLFSLLERRAHPDGPWLASAGEQPTIVDIVAMATYQFAKGLFGIDLTKQHPRLRIAIEAFSKRDSAQSVAEFPPAFVKVAPVLSVQ